MPQRTKKKAVRRSVRKHPTPREAKLMQFNLYDLGYLSAEANGVQENVYRFIAHPWDSHKIEFEPRGLSFVFQEAVPTLLIMKLAAVVEDALDQLWSIRFPEVDIRRLRHEDKLRVVERLHGIDGASIRELWKLRNECAHSIKRMAKRPDFDKYFETVFQFLKAFEKKNPNALAP
jgi:hypothetical protein